MGSGSRTGNQVDNQSSNQGWFNLISYFSKPIGDNIVQRYSCRTYQESVLESSKQELLANFAALSRMDPFGNSARFELVSANENDRRALRGLGTYGFIKGATGFIVGAIEKDIDNLEGYGYLLEGIILYATELGLGTCWLGGTFTKSSFARKINSREDELVPAVASVGYIAKKPRRIETLLRGRGGYERRLPWERLFFDSNFATPLKRERTNGYGQVLEMVRLSPSASNRQPWRIVNEGRKFHFYLQRTPGYRQSPLVRLTTVADLQRIDMGIAMNHFELMARDLSLEGYWEMNEPPIESADELTEYTASWCAEGSSSAEVNDLG